MQVTAINSGSAGLEVSDEVFGKEFNETLVHQLVVKYLAAGRAGTKGQKNRSAVSGGGSKPFRQKGTGRARAGSTRGPIWRGGGVTFAAQPRSFEQKLNKKMYKAGLRSIFSELIRQDRLAIHDDINVSDAKTKAFVSKFGSLTGGKLLLITSEPSEALLLSARNLANVAILTPVSVDPVSLVAADKVVVSSAALKQIEERLA
jgi:large subunit ribosomal protein L4